ncbi:MAG TPA: SDR family NAD(P)-dependent oxidoreductase [Verrucomicrobiae bacterium]|nr:SDR family NAD(P)-dependent oxidoreductase [Verrucomicrobiae bacterium]
MTSRDTRRVLLTGASSGIGLETARILVSRGFEVWGTSRDLTRLPEFPRFHRVTMDLGHRDSVRHGFAAASEDAGGFDLLINNAGAGAFGGLDTMPAEVVREQFQILVDAPLELIRLALPSMRQRGAGTIINVTSLAAQFPIPFMAPYSAAKSALSVLTASLRAELFHTPIRVVEVRPGDINTPFHDRTNRLDTAKNAEEQRRMKNVWETQLRCMAASPRPDRVARVILRAITTTNPPPVMVVGGIFQARVATLGARLLPLRLQEFVLRKYYRL